MTIDPSSEGPAAPRPKDVDPLAALRKPSGGVASVSSAGKYAGLGFQFVFSILFFLWVGQWVDRKVGTDGIFLILGVFLGAGAAFYSMYRNLMADQERDEAEALAVKQAKAESDRQSRGER
jgi:ATP synthase protein I